MKNAMTIIHKSDDPAHIVHNYSIETVFNTKKFLFHERH